MKTSRRKLLLGALASVGVGLTALWSFRRPILSNLFMKGSFDTSLLNNAPGEMDDICILSSKAQEGPFFFPSPERINITEDRQGKALSLKFQLINHPECKPIQGAIVDIWHCDAEGGYSGYPAEIAKDVWASSLFLLNNRAKNSDELHVDPVNDNRFLRGRQSSDSEGWVAFNTILPGWYDGRVPHVHAKIILNANEQFDTQFFFDTDLCNRIYTSVAPYDKSGKCPLKLSEDIVLADAGKGDGLMLQIKEADDLLTSTAKIGIQRS